MTHTPINRIGYPTDDDNHAPEMLGHLFCFLAGMLTCGLGIVAGWSAYGLMQ